MLTALYRHFDADGRLLYVGISLSPARRLSNHAAGSRWADKIAHVTIEWLPTRQEALAAEGRAIASENPLHNIVGRRNEAEWAPAGGPAPRVPVYVDRPEYVAAHFNTSARTVDRMIREGMPRERVGGRFRYDLRACEAWAKERARQERLAAEAAKRADARMRATEARAALMAAFGPAEGI